MQTAKYDAIGIGYDGTRRADPNIVDRLLALLRPSMKPNRFLDIACGTGNYTSCLSAGGLSMTGVDQSETMLSTGRSKLSDIEWQCADIEDLPFEDGLFAGAICTNAIHHFSDLRAAFREVARVLSPGARFVILTASREQMRSYWLNTYFPVALERSIEQMPPTGSVEAMLTQAGMQSVETEPWNIPLDPVDLFLYAGKHKPELYLDQTVRAGISTFSNLADPDEIATGLDRLGRDIETGRIARIIERYRTSSTVDGDYTFYTAQRK